MATLSRKQQQSLARSTARVNVWEGSIRSGKTFVSFLRFLAFIAAYTGAGSFVIIGKSRDSVWRNLFEPVEKDPALAFLAPFVSYRAGAPTARILGKRVSVLGANDARSALKVQGMTVAGAYGDEITTWFVDFFKMLLGRMSPPGAQFFGTTNPDNPQHWLKTEYIDRANAGDLPNWRIFHFRLEDNDTLTAEYVESIKREYTGLWYKRYIEGLWVSAEGAIYQDWDEGRHVIPWAEMPRIARVLAVGMDYGTTNATAAVLLGITDERDEHGRRTPRLILMDEWGWDSRQTMQRLSDVKLAARFIDWLTGTVHAPYDLDLTPEYIFLDPSAASMHEALHERHITAWDADNEVGAGIADIASLLATRRMLVTDRCRQTIRETPGYVWDEKATKNGEDKPVKDDDHWLDAWRYAVRSTKAVWEPIMAAAYHAV